MAHVGFGCVKGTGVMTNVLGGVEDTERKAVKEVAGGEQAHHGAKGETSAFCKTLFRMGSKDR